MKKTYIVIIVLAAVVTLLAAEKKTVTSPPGTHEEFRTEVLKVFSATDSNAVFRAYLVKWKGQEVVVSDPLVASDYHVGDKVSVLAMNQPFPKGGHQSRLLHFQILPPPLR